MFCRLRLLCVVGVVGCAASTELECITWSRPLTPKDDLAGQWRYNAEVVEGPALLRGTMVSHGGLQWTVDEDFVFVHDDAAPTPDSVLLAFPLDAHLSVERGCVVEVSSEVFAEIDPDPPSDARWYEQTHAAIDWATEYAVKAPVRVTDWEPVAASAMGAASFTYDDADGLARISTLTQYAVRVCDTCDVQLATVEHVLIRER